MEEDTEFAALSAGLLARKGQATPAMDGFTHARFGLPDEERARLERGFPSGRKPTSQPQPSFADGPDPSAYADDDDEEDDIPFLNDGDEPDGPELPAALATETEDDADEASAPLPSTERDADAEAETPALLRAPERRDAPEPQKRPSLLRKAAQEAENPIRAIRDDLRKRIADALGIQGRLGAGRKEKEADLARRAVRVASDSRPDPACDRPCEEAAKSARRVQVSFRVSTRDFMRLKLAAAELGRPSQDLIIESVHRLLDEYGVEQFDECACLARAADATDERDAETLKSILSDEGER